MKLFIVVRQDLPPGALLAQAVHAAIDFGHYKPAEEIRWRVMSNTVVVLGAPDEPYLRTLERRCIDREIIHVVVREPDLGNSVTAMAIAANGAGLVRGLPLAMRGIRHDPPEVA